MTFSGTGLASDHPERALVLSYAPVRARAALAALLALDDSLGRIVRSTRDPLVGQMRLTWWHEALAALDDAPPPAEPVLRCIADTVLPRGVTGATLAAMTDGWERLLDTPIDLAAHARERGAGLFAAMALVLGVRDTRIGAAGEGWALADLAGHVADPAGHVADPALAQRAAAAATDRLAAAFIGRWSRDARPLGALALLARGDLGRTPVGSPRRVGRLLWHRISGF